MVGCCELSEKIILDMSRPTVAQWWAVGELLGKTLFDLCGPTVAQRKDIKYLDIVLYPYHEGIRVAIVPGTLRKLGQKEQFCLVTPYKVMFIG